MQVNENGTIYGFFYRNGRYSQDEYYIRFFNSEVERNDAVKTLRSEDREIIKFELPVKDFIKHE